MEKEKEILSLPLPSSFWPTGPFPSPPARWPSFSFSFLSSRFLPGPAQPGELATVAAMPSLLLSAADGLGPRVGTVTHLPRPAPGQAATAATPTSPVHEEVATAVLRSAVRPSARFAIPELPSSPIFTVVRFAVLPSFSPCL